MRGGGGGGGGTRGQWFPVAVGKSACSHVSFSCAYGSRTTTCADILMYCNKAGRRGRDGVRKKLLAFG